MKNKFLVSVFCLALCSGLFSCERMANEEETETVAVEAPAAENKLPATVQDAIRADARLARTMSLARFSEHMQSRHSYYKQFEKVSYEDDFVKIKIKGEDLKIETEEGKAKFEEDEAKIKTDTYKRKWERE